MEPISRREPITRRKFFFFGLAAGVGLMLPDRKIELTRDELLELIRQDMRNAMIANRRIIDSALYGIPYHENNAFVSNRYYGISREFITK